jgi:glycosyltransferase involved in cell wall biosynthesis
VRIAVVSTSYPESEGDPSGHFVRAEVRSLEREGHDVTVIRPTPGGAFGWPGVAARLAENPLRIADAACFLARARRELLRGNFERATCHWVVPGVLPITAGARCLIEGVSHGGDVRFLLALPAPVRSLAVSDIARRLEVWRFVSQALLASVADRVSAAAGRHLLRCAVVRESPIELPDVSEAAHRAREEHGSFVVAVGRLVPGKRFDRAIDRASLDRRRIFVIGDGPERARLEAHARRRGAQAVFLGTRPRDEALSWIAAAEALVHASVEEGLSTVVREAAALGTPVVRVT